LKPNFWFLPRCNIIIKSKDTQHKKQPHDPKHTHCHDALHLLAPHGGVMGGDGPHRSSVSPNLAFGLFPYRWDYGLARKWRCVRHGIWGSVWCLLQYPGGSLLSAYVGLWTNHTLWLQRVDRNQDIQEYSSTKVIFPTKWNMVFLF
jgi:hypothetical protein